MKIAKHFCLILIALAAGCSATPLEKTTNSSTISGSDVLYRLPAGIQTRWATAENPKGEKGVAGSVNAGRKGAPCRFNFKAGESHVLAEAAGSSGTVRRIWITINDRSPKMLRGLKLEMFWDGAAKPAVSAPLGDFFCHGLGHMATFQSALFSSPEGRSFNCTIPMPFRTGMKIVLTNESGADLAMLFYEVDYTLGDRHGDDMLYFHAHYRRENPTTLQQDYELLPQVTGHGRYLGVNIGVIANQSLYFTSWWGEGEVKIYLDGDREQSTLCGTGTEDFIGSGWGQGCYANLYQGCPYANDEKLSYGFYRFHVPDPVFFYKDIRVTIQQIGCWGPPNKKQLREIGKPIYLAGAGLKVADLSDANSEEYGLFERQDDWSSCCYFYLDCPTNTLPSIDPVEKRIAGL
jgi:hypothetical protein